MYNFLYTCYSFKISEFFHFDKYAEDSTSFETSKNESKIGKEKYLDSSQEDFFILFSKIFSIS